MRVFLIAGCIYLVGTAILLALKPELMFTREGVWKEFGIGRNPATHTWMPFWLFAILWAILSYVIVLVIAGNTGLAGVSVNKEVSVATNIIEPENVSMKAMTPPRPNGSVKSIQKKPTSTSEMKKGYYILDTNETMKRGIPKYIYLGPEAPNLVYHNMISTESE